MSTSIVSARPESRLRSLRGADFRRITSTGQRLGGRLLTLFVLRRPDGTPRAGFTAGRRVGGAVARNRARRLMREAWRLISPGTRGSFDVVVVAQPAIRGLGLEQVRSEMERLLETAGVRG